jgi:predicted HTH transcriptional regulator
MVSEFKPRLDKVRAILAKRGINLNQRLFRSEVGTKSSLEDILKGGLNHNAEHFVAVIEYIAQLLKSDEAGSFTVTATIAVIHDLVKYHRLSDQMKEERKKKRLESRAKKEAEATANCQESSKEAVRTNASNPEVSKESLTVANDTKDNKRSLSIIPRRNQILKLLGNDPKMTTEKLLECLNTTETKTPCSIATVKRDLKSLESAGLLKRVGGRSDSGHWEVTVASRPSSKK